MARRGGAAAVTALLDDSVDVLERKLQLLERHGWFADVHKAREALDRLLPTLRAATDSVTRELYISRVAERLGIPRDTVAEETAAVRARPAPPPPPPRSQPPSRPEAPLAGVPRTPGASIERKLLRLLLHRPEWLERARGEVAPDRFAVPAFRQIYEALVALPEGAPVGDALAALDDRGREVWERLVGGGEPVSGPEADREYVGALAALEEMLVFPEIGAETDPMEMNRRWRALSPEGQARFQMYLATTRRSRRGRGRTDSEE